MRNSIVTLSALVVTTVGCAYGDGVMPSGPAEGPAPHVLALSSYEASVGTLIEAYGVGLPGADEGQVELVFRGDFRADSGTTAAVDVTLPARAVDGGTARWTSFGPYQIPFGPGDHVGTFEGTIAARVTTPDGAVKEDDAPQTFTLTVRPSIVVREFQPTTASCAGPVSRALGGAAYRLRVQAVGFEPVSYTYTFATPTIGADPLAVRHIATGGFDEFGSDGSFVLPDVPTGVPAYGAVVGVQAVGRDGSTYRTLFAINVHRPLEVFYNGNVDVAEVYEPTPVSACIPGGTNGRHVNYEESSSETRTRTYNINWNEHWMRTHTVSRDTQSTIGWNETNGVGFSTTDGQTFHWSIGASTEISGNVGVSLPELVSIGVGTRIGFNSMVGGDHSTSDSASQNRSQGVHASETTTDAESVSDSTGGGSGSGYTWQVSSTDTIARGFGGSVIANTYGVFYRQTLRLIRRAAVVTYNQCGAASVIGDVDFMDWTWSPDLTLGESCPPLPQSNLPRAECYVDPCDVQ